MPQSRYPSLTKLLKNLNVPLTIEKIASLPCHVWAAYTRQKVANRMYFQHSSPQILQISSGSSYQDRRIVLQFCHRYGLVRPGASNRLICCFFQEKFPQIYLFDWFIWPPSQFINFRYVKRFNALLCFQARSDLYRLGTSLARTYVRMYIQIHGRMKSELLGVILYCSIGVNVVIVNCSVGVNVIIEIVNCSVGVNVVIGNCKLQCRSKCSNCKLQCRRKCSYCKL